MQVSSLTPEETILTAYLHAATEAWGPERAEELRHDIEGAARTTRIVMGMRLGALDEEPDFPAPAAVRRAEG